MFLKWVRIILIFCIYTSFLEFTTALASEGFDSIATSNYANKNLQYYYYIPKDSSKNLEEAFPLLVMVPGLSGRGDNFVTQLCKDFAEKERFIIIAPSFVFDEKNWKDKKSYHYPSIWSGNAFLKIVRDFKAKQGIKISKFYLIGHSAGAQFVLRFALWKPELCAASAAHASGGSIRPKRYAAGKFFVTVGNRDTDGRKRVAQEFYNFAEKYGLNVKYKEYDTGHGMVTEQFIDTFNLFSKGLTRRHKDAENPSKYTLKIISRSEPVLANSTVYLKNGRKMKGRIVKESEDSIILELGDTRSIGTITLKRASIKAIKGD